jgi:hypothetical protein
MAEAQPTRNRVRPEGEKLLDRRNSPASKDTEELFPGMTQAARNRILEAIQNCNTLEATDTQSPILYTYSLLLRLEETYEKAKAFQQECYRAAEVDLACTKERLEEALTGVDKKGKPFPQSVIDRLESHVRACENEMVNARWREIQGEIINTSSQVKLVQKWMEDIVSQQKVIESKQKVEYISLLEHSAVLEAMLSVLSMALLQAGLPEPTRLLVFKKFNELQKKYPVIDTDLERIRQRLFGVPEQVIDIVGELAAPSTLEAPPSARAALQALNDVTSGK